MATKKAPSRKSTKPRRPKPKLSLEVVSANQRKINGNVYLALEHILSCLTPIALAGDRAKLAEAKKIIYSIPGFDPPGCGGGWP
jgi:hypothetical protein